MGFRRRRAGVRTWEEIGSGSSELMAGEAPRAGRADCDDEVLMWSHGDPLAAMDGRRSRSI
jgi:hypothetical protein